MSKQEEEKAVPGSMQKLTVEAIRILPAEASSRLHYADWKLCYKPITDW